MLFPTHFQEQPRNDSADGRMKVAHSDSLRSSLDVSKSNIPDTICNINHESEPNDVTQNEQNTHQIQDGCSNFREKGRCYWSEDGECDVIQDPHCTKVGIKKWKCRHCGKIQNDGSNCKRHVRTHTVCIHNLIPLQIYRKCVPKMKKMIFFSM